jgi:hypothetical protein
MKLRIKGNSLRLRISQPEMAQLLRDGSVEETICFGAADARLTYALMHSESVQAIGLSYQDRRATVMLSSDAVRRWAGGDEVGIYGDVDTCDGPLALLVEKDYACLDRDDPHDADAFPNPKVGVAC